jgi:hypothetical protein
MKSIIATKLFHLFEWIKINKVMDCSEYTHMAYSYIGHWVPFTLPLTTRRATVEVNSSFVFGRTEVEPRRGVQDWRAS